MASPTNPPATPVKKRKPNSRARRRMRDMKAQQAQANQVSSPINNKPQSEPQKEQIAMPMDIIQEESDTEDTRSEDKIKLDAMMEKILELQGYVNTLQDALTIGMKQLAATKRQVIAMAVAIERSDTSSE